MAVFVIDKGKRPLMPCSEKRARRLLEAGRAVVHNLAPFTIRMKDRLGGDRQDLSLKLDPGSRVTGFALVRNDAGRQHVLWLAELTHRGLSIRSSLEQRKLYRKRRRGHLRYRKPRFNNRARPDGWLPPSLHHRVATVTAWVKRIDSIAPVTGISQELVRFDMQALDNPEIKGTEYRQGALAGYEVREYLLEKWGRRCAYCDAEGKPLQIEHIVARSKGGSERVSNLALACEPCNQRKGADRIEVFLQYDPDRAKRILAQAQLPLRDAAAVNATRLALYRRLAEFKKPVQTSTGGRTKWNRCRLGIPKTHSLDAACTGDMRALVAWNRPVLLIRATGRGSYQRTRLNKFGFPRAYLMRRKMAFGFQTGDWVRADVPSGKKAGVHVGRVAVRATGSFNIQTAGGTVDGIGYRNCRKLKRADGYGYSLAPKQSLK